MSAGDCGGARLDLGTSSIGDPDPAVAEASFLEVVATLLSLSWSSGLVQSTTCTCRL
jgi:hypothetical protein